MENDDIVNIFSKILSNFIKPDQSNLLHPCYATSIQMCCVPIHLTMDD